MNIFCLVWFGFTFLTWSEPKKLDLVALLRTLCCCKKDRIQSNLSYRPPPNSDHLSTTITPKPARPILVLNLLPNNDHLSTMASNHLNLVPKERNSCLQRPLLVHFDIFIELYLSTNMCLQSLLKF